MRNIWADRWDQGRTGWDLHGAHPYTSALVAKWETLSGSELNARDVWVPGCGHAHDAAWLAQHGANVIASDIVAQAIAAAQSLYQGTPHLQLICEDALAMQPDSAAAVDLVFDRAMLCALSGSEREMYVQSCLHRLRPGGYLLSLPFTKVSYPDGRLSGPPFSISHQECLALFSAACDLCYWLDTNEPSLDGLIQAEAQMVWQKKIEMV